jgi:hypothetical protein
VGNGRKPKQLLCKNVDEMIMIDNQKWISMHVYMMKNWVRTPLLLIFQWIKMGATIENIMVIILQNSIKFKGLVEEEFIFWCVCLRCDGDSMFQGHHTSIIVQAKDNAISYFINLHCMKHKTNPITIVLSKLYSNIVHWDNVASIIHFFAHNPNECLKFSKLIETFPTMLPTRLITKGQKLLRNIKTHWISM